MRFRSYAGRGGLLVFAILAVGATLAVFRGGPAGVSVGVYSYERQGDEVSASLVLTNIGRVSLAVPLKFGCQVDRVSGFTNYLVETPYSVFLQPRQYVILSNELWRVRLPADTSGWRVNVRVRRLSVRERFVNALRQAGLNPRMLSRLAGRPRKEADDQWLECQSSLLKFPVPPLEGLELQNNERNGA
jgi:hypothetical protein